MKTVHISPAASGMFIPSSTLHSNLLTMPISREDELMLVELISKIFLLPWYNVSDTEQEWASRSSHDAFILSLLEPLNQAADKSGKDHNDASTAFKQTLPVLSHIVQSHCDSRTRSKHLLFESLKHSLGLASSLLPEYLEVSEVGEDFLLYFLTVFDVLRAQVRFQFIEETVGVILNVFTQKNLAGTVLSEGATGSRLLEKFFKMLTLIVVQPGNSSKSLIPGMISLVLNQISPLLSQVLIPDLLTSFFEFLYQFLFNNFKYFFKSNLLNNLNVPLKEQIETVDMRQNLSKSCKSMVSFSVNLTLIQTRTTTKAGPAVLFFALHDLPYLLH